MLDMARLKVLAAKRTTGSARPLGRSQVRQDLADAQDASMDQAISTSNATCAASLASGANFATPATPASVVRAK